MFMLTCWLGLCCLVGSGVEGGLRCEPPGIDLGQVRAGQVFRKEVRVTNTGLAAVAVTEIKSSCGCLHTKLEPGTLAPGQTGVLRLQINSLSAPPGVQGWRVRLMTGEGVAAEFLLRAEVVQELVLNPASLTLYGDRGSNHTLTLTDRRAKPLQLRSATTTSPLLTATVTSSTTVQVQVRPGFTEGRHEEEVILTTEDPQYPQLHFPVRVVIRPKQRFVALPREVELHGSASEPLLSRLVTLRDQQGQPLQVERIETSHPSLTAEVVSVQQASAVLRVSLAARLAGSGAFTGRVVVFFRGTTQTLTLPVRCP